MKNFIILFGLMSILTSQACKKTPKEVILTPNPLSHDDSIRLLLQQDLNLIFLPGTQQLGTCSALKNGQNWAASTGASPYIDNTLFINISTVDEQGTLRELFDFFKVPKIVGKYKFGIYLNADNNNIKPSYQRVYADGDVSGWHHLADPFYVDQDYFEVTMVDTLNRVISGRFDVHLTDSIPPISYPLYTFAHFSEGVFNVKY
jgi:hypothetical protein